MSGSPITLPSGLSVTPSYDGSSISLKIDGLPCGENFVIAQLPLTNGFAIGIAPANAVYNELWVQQLPPCGLGD